jgi:hydrogenase maturation protein HypF
MPLPGGEVSIRRPYRLAYGYLKALGLEMPRLPSLLRIPEEEQAVIAAQVAQGINTPLTSSCGRLFDAVAALLDLCGTITFEGQAAIALEMIASQGPVDPYPFSIEEEGGKRVIKVGGLIAALASDAEDGKDVSHIAARFHHTMARIVGDVAAHISRQTGIKDVVLSGGCFQNRLLTDLTAAVLGASGLRCLTHRQVPCNDGGISLGQAAVASARL